MKIALISAIACALSCSLAAQPVLAADGQSDKLAAAELVLSSLIDGYSKACLDGGGEAETKEVDARRVETSCRSKERGNYRVGAHLSNSNRLTIAAAFADGWSELFHADAQQIKIGKALQPSLEVSSKARSLWMSVQLPK